MPLSNPLSTLSLLAILASPLGALADPVYTMTFLPPNVIETVGIDNQGRIALSFEEPTIAQAGLWSGGSIMGLGFLGTGSVSVAFGISKNSGMVAGYSEISSGTDFGPHAFLYSNGTINDLGTLGGIRSVALAVNDAGQAAGDSDLPGGANHAFRYSGGVMRDLGTLGGDNSHANAINNAGVVVGNASLAENATWHAYMTGELDALIDLGTLPGGTFSAAAAINDAGLIAGTSNGTGFEDGAHAFLYQQGVMSDIGTLGGLATVEGINNLGQVVGQSNGAGYLYTNGQMVDLNSLIDGADGWRVVAASGINDAQQIVSEVFKEGVGNRFVLLDLIPAVPEPSTYALLLAGLAWLGAGGRARMRSAALQACQ